MVIDKKALKDVAKMVGGELDKKYASFSATKSEIVDESRIEMIIGRLQEVWKKHPQLRLSQLIGNVYPNGIRDPYYINDKDFIEEIEKFYFEGIISTTWEPNKYEGY